MGKEQINGVQSHDLLRRGVLRSKYSIFAIRSNSLTCYMKFGTSAPSSGSTTAATQGAELHGG